jgi:hypothetical protein
LRRSCFSGPSHPAMSSENFLIGYDAKDETLLRPHLHDHQIQN